MEPGTPNTVLDASLPGPRACACEHQDAGACSSACVHGRRKVRLPMAEKCCSCGGNATQSQPWKNSWSRIVLGLALAHGASHQRCIGSRLGVCVHCSGIALRGERGGARTYLLLEYRTHPKALHTVIRSGFPGLDAQKIVVYITGETYAHPRKSAKGHTHMTSIDVKPTTSRTRRRAMSLSVCFNAGSAWCIQQHIQLLRILNGANVINLCLADKCMNTPVPVASAYA